MLAWNSNSSAAIIRALSLNAWRVSHRFSVTVSCGMFGNGTMLCAARAETARGKVMPISLPIRVISIRSPSSIASWRVLLRCSGSANPQVSAGVRNFPLLVSMDRILRDILALYHTTMREPVIKNLPIYLRDFAIPLALKAYWEHPGSGMPQKSGDVPGMAPGEADIRGRRQKGRSVRPGMPTAPPHPERGLPTKPI
ncbi:MAG: hypothetical protein BWX50_00555 [Euryarchaeota archaeon ADurb.Bin009]|nr:MAG: hypothetical protein BWX50_00555 [Euryarchaeota archaeon ADurb.Bin009]